jgi:hypothetical protein
MSNDHIRPSSIEGIKQLAKRVKKSDGTQHAAALDKASQVAVHSCLRITTFV